jgi:hypothetical protein
MADVGTYYIYEVVNTITGDKYVGSTCNVGRRWTEHKYTAFKPNDRAYHRPLYEDMRRYGADVFDKRVLEILTCSNEERLKREQYYIDTMFPTYNQKSSYVHCPHGRQHQYCRDCGGSSICEHNRRRSACRDCQGTCICEHNRRRQKCKDCHGSSICEHKRLRYNCKDCGGSSICEHKRLRHQCKDCGGVSICTHGRRRHSCRDCNNYVCPYCDQRVCSKQFLSKHILKQHFSSMLSALTDDTY